MGSLPGRRVRRRLAPSPLFFRPRFVGESGGRYRLFPPATSNPALRQTRDRAGIRAQASLHSLRHSFAAHLLEADESLPKIQRLLGHSSIKTTMIYLKVANVERVASPLDRFTGVELH